jgi:carbonic anhydrase
VSGFPDQTDEVTPADVPEPAVTPADVPEPVITADDLPEPVLAPGIEHLLDNASTYAESTSTEELAGPPELKVAIVTCMDCRIDPAALLGLARGAAHVLRNAGGVVSEDVIRSLSISQHKLRTREIMLIHHTRCGMQTITDDGFRAELAEMTGMTPPFAVDSFIDLDADVRQSMRRVRSSQFIPYRDAVRGFVYDVDDHSLREVVPD